MKYTLLKSDKKDFLHPLTHRNIRVFRVFWLKDVTCGDFTAKEGTVGGWIADEGCLSQDDDSIVLHNAVVFDTPGLRDTAVIEDGKVFGNAVLQDCLVKTHARVYGKVVAKNSICADSSNVTGEYVILESSFFNSARIKGQGTITKSKFMGGAMVSGTNSISESQLSDVCAITDCNLINCHLSGRVVLAGQNLHNETLKREIELNVVSGEGEPNL